MEHKVVTREQLLKVSIFWISLADLISGSAIVISIPIYYVQIMALDWVGDNQEKENWYEYACRFLQALFLMTMVYRMILQERKSKLSFTFCYVCLSVHCATLMVYLWVPLNDIGIF